MAEYLIQEETLDSIADAINAKTGKSASMTPAEMVTAIAAIPSGTSPPLLIKYEAITVTSDRITSQTGGNAKAFSDEFLPSLSSTQYPTILVLVENTNESDYAAQSAVRLSGVADGVDQTTRTGVRKNQVGINMASASFDFYVGAGSIVHRYVFVREEPTS